MAIVVGNTTQMAASSGAGPFTFSHDNNKEDVYVIVAYRDDADNTLAATYNGEAMTSVLSKITSGGSVLKVQIFKKEGAASGSNTVSITSSGSIGSVIGAGAISVSGVHNSSPTDATATGGESPGSEDPRSTTITTTVANALIIDGISDRSAGLTVGGSQTQISNVGTGDKMASSYRAATSATGYAMDWDPTENAEDWAQAIIALTPALAPTVTTSAASDVSTTSATGNGNVTSDGGDTITERGFVIATTANPTTSDTKFTVAGTTGAFNGSMTGLSPGVGYHYRAYAINAIGTSYGADTEFTTTTTTPSVTTSAASSITSSSAQGNGNVTSDGGAAISERGFVWSTSANPTTSDNKVAVAGTTGSYSGSMTSLSASTTYHYRAYAINANGTSYGADTEFTTSSGAATAPTVTTGAATNVDTDSADLAGNVTSDGGASVTERGFVYSTSENPTTANTKIIVSGTTGAYSGSVSDLSSGTTYHVRAYATNSQGTSYGADVSFTTTAQATVRKYFIYRVYDANVYVETWTKEVLSEPRFRTTINGGPGEMIIELGRKFDDFGEDEDVKLNNKVECWVVDREAPNGRLQYVGYISGYRPIVNGPIEKVEITLLGYVAELQRMILRDSSGNTTVTYSSVDPSAILRDVIDKYRAIGGSLRYTNDSIPLTNTSVSYTFNTNTIKECLDKIIELCPAGWYFRIDPDNIVYLQPMPIVATHTFTLGLNVEKLETYRRVEDLVNRVLFIGGGNPALFRKYENTSSQSTYGLYEIKKVDQRVTVVGTAQTISNALINARKDPEIRSKFEIIDSNGPKPTRGYDIETIKVGQTLQVKNLKTGAQTATLWDVGVYDVDVWDQTIANTAADVIQILSLEYRPDSIIIEASSRLPQIAKRIEDVERNLEVTQSVNNPAAPS